jgi:hypothetical protein
MKGYFKAVASRNRLQAAAMVNDRGLMFYTLYQLHARN